MTPRFRLGTTVYHRLDPEVPGLVTGITYRPTGICYLVTWPSLSETSCYEMELTDEQSFGVN